VFLFKYYWYDTTDRGIKGDPHYGLVKINSKARLHTVNDVFVFTKQCQQFYYTYTPSSRKDRSRVDWLFFLKTKPRGRVEVFQDENEDTSVGDDVFEVSKLVEPYRVAPSTNFEENSNFRIFDNSLVDVDAEELNVVLNSSGQAQANEDDDSNVINVEDCDGADDDSIEGEEEDHSFWLIIRTWKCNTIKKIEFDYAIMHQICVDVENKINYTSWADYHN